MAQPSPKGKGKMADSDEDRDFHSRKRHNSSASSNSTITGAPLSPGNVAHSPGETSDQGAAGISGMARSRTMTVLTSPPRFPGTPGREIHLHENGNNRKAFIVECESPDSSAIDDLVDDSVDGSAGGSVDGSVSGLSHAEWSSSVHTTPAAKLAVPEVQSNTTTTTATLAGPNPSGGQNIGITATPTMGTQINNLIEYVEAAGAQATISEGHVSNLDRVSSFSQHCAFSFQPLS